MAALAGICLIVFTITGLGTAALAAEPTVSDGIFELDGNATPDGAVAGVDWNDLEANANAGGALRYTNEPDPAGETIFRGGGSKDDLPIAGWKQDSGSVPAKDEITNAFAAAFVDANGAGTADDDLLVNFGLDRFAQNGDANVGFWFLKDDLPAAPPAGGGFGVDHQNGDVLVISGFSSGGDVPTIQVYEWDEGNGTDGNANLKTLYSSAVAECGTQGAGDPVPLACGIANRSPIAADAQAWSYVPKQGTAQSYPTAAFFEGGVNLTDLLGTGGGSTPCFSSFIAETRSSTSVDAVLKDFVAEDFELCGSAVSIGQNATNGIGEEHTFTVTVTQTFAGGSPTPATSGHVDVILDHSVNDSSITVGTSTCDVRPVGATPHTAATPDNLSAAGTCTVSFTSSVAGTVTGTAFSVIDLGGGNTSSASTNSVAPNSAPAVKTFLDGTLRWLKHDQGGALLGGATFQVCRTHNWNSDTASMDLIVDNADPPQPAPVCISVPDDVTAADEGTAGDDSPDSDTTAGELQLDDLILGRYTIQETQAPPGYVGDLTVKGPFNLTTSSTDGGTLTGPPIIVNQALFKVIVLTCNVANNTLVTSEVTLDVPGTNDTKDSIASPPGSLTNAQLCGLGGAAYNNLPPNTYTGGSVEVPKVP